MRVQEFGFHALCVIDLLFVKLTLLDVRRRRQMETDFRVVMGDDPLPVTPAHAPPPSLHDVCGASFWQNNYSQSEQ